jgi:hypothetical protein
MFIYVQLGLLLIDLVIVLIFTLIFIFILNTSMRAVYCIVWWNILATKVRVGDTKGPQIVLGRGVTVVTFERNLLSQRAGFQYAP